MLTLNNSHFPKELVNLGPLLNSLTFVLVTWGPKQLPYTSRNVISSRLAGILSKFFIFILPTGLVGVVLKQPRTVNFHGALSSAEKKRNNQLKVSL